MDSFQNNYAKKQRNPKNQRDRRKVQEKEIDTSNSPNPVETNSEFNPQPQRANRRQRNEPTSNKTSAEKPSPATQEKNEGNSEKPKTENFVVDHSNLKRETEEIAKLKKKFVKREITSNWHRYSAPDTTENKEEEDENAPADFSDLLQVPVSKGGHLQLKDERDWSTATGAEFSGFFALDLELLNKSLACIPLHEQLRLPKYLFTEEELNNFDANAELAKTHYDPSKDENYSDESLNKFEKSLRNALNESKKVYIEPSSNRVENVEDSVSDLIDPTDWSVKPELPCTEEIEVNKNNKPSVIMVNNDQLLKRENSKEKDISVEDEEEKTSNDKTLVELNIDVINKMENLDILKQDSTVHLTQEKCSEQTFIFPETTVDNNSNKYLDISEENSITVKPVLDKGANILKDKNKTKKRTENQISKDSKVKISDLNNGRTSNTHINENFSKISNERNSPAKDEIVSKILDKTKEIRLEDDDDDLDFLLSLKKPVPSQTKRETKPAAVQESSFLPGGTKVAKPTTQEKHSELDDWLDSVLED